MTVTPELPLLSASLDDSLSAAAASWEGFAFQTGPGDRAAAEEGVRQAYVSAGLPAPEKIVWFASPARGAVAAALLSGHAAALRLAGLATLADQVTAELSAGLAIGGLTGSTGGDTLRHGATTDPLTGGVRDDIAMGSGVAGSVLLGGGVTDGRLVAEMAMAGLSVRDQVRTVPWERARARALAALGPSGWPLAWSRSGELLWNPVNTLVTRIRRTIGELAPERDDTDDSTVVTLLRGITLDAVLGQHDAPWLSLFQALGEAETDGLARVAREAGWWWPFERVAIMCERPSELHRDELGRPHRGEGPAMSWSDGFALYAWHGMPVPEDFSRSLGELTVERIDTEANAELRRVMVEHFGYDRYIDESGATPIHRDDTGVLWRIELPDDEPIVMVEVINATPEPDGTRRKYWLRVPPYVRTARQGVAWTFNLTEDDYHPTQET